jgi:hypothetical protein
MDLTVLDLDGNLQARQNLSAGAYEITGLTTPSGIVFGITADDNFKGYGKVPFVAMPVLATGGDITYSGNYKIHTFLTSSLVGGTDLPAVRYAHGASVLPDGRILVTGGKDNTVWRAETYFGTIAGDAITWASGTVIKKFKVWDLPLSDAEVVTVFSMS